MNQPKSSTELGSDLDDALNRLEAKVSDNTVSTKAPAVNSLATASLVLSLLLSLIAIGAAAYAVYVIDPFGAKTAPQIDAITEINAVAQSNISQIADLRGQVETLAGRQAENTTELDLQLQLYRQMQAALAEVQADRGTSSQDWLLAEVEYLLRLANQKILMEKRVTGAVALLHAADEILQEAESVTAFPVRAAIAKDLIKLQATANINTEGQYLKLAAVKSQVDDLKQKRPVFVSKQTSAPEPPLSTSEQSVLDVVVTLANRLFESLYRLVDYRSGDIVIQPILPPKEEYYLRQNLVMKIEQAQLALLRGDQVAYDQSIADSLVWVERYFEAADGLTAAVLQELAAARSLKVEQHIPDISDSLRAIRQFMKDFHRAPDKSVDESLT